MLKTFCQAEVEISARILRKQGKILSWQDFVLICIYRVFHAFYQVNVHRTISKDRNDTMSTSSCIVFVLFVKRRYSIRSFYGLAEKWQNQTGKVNIKCALIPNARNVLLSNVVCCSWIFKSFKYAQLCSCFNNHYNCGGYSFNDRL